MRNHFSKRRLENPDPPPPQKNPTKPKIKNKKPTCVSWKLACGSRWYPWLRAACNYHCFDCLQLIAPSSVFNVFLCVHIFFFSLKLASGQIEADVCFYPGYNWKITSALSVVSLTCSGYKILIPPRLGTLYAVLEIPVMQQETWFSASFLIVHKQIVQYTLPWPSLVFLYSL